jgi:hypothetical protein
VLGVEDELFHGTRGVVGRRRARPTEAGADVALHVSDLASPYLGAFTFERLAAAGRARELRPGGWRARPRCSRRPFRRTVRGLLMATKGRSSRIQVTPCADLDEFGQAVFAIGQYFALDPTSEWFERFSKNLPFERMHAAREGGRIVGGAGAFPFELTFWRGPTAGVVVGTPRRIAAAASSGR